MRGLAGAVFAAGAIALAAHALLALARIDHLDQMPGTITVTGEGEVQAIPDIGEFTFTVSAEGETAEAAQVASGETINEILEFVRGSNVMSEDITTANYNLFPRYRYEERICEPGRFCGGEQILDGYEVSQSVTVKVRDVDTASGIISGVGERGATNISGLQFVVDERDALEDEARLAAIADAQARAEILASELGVSLDRIIGYYEENAQYYEPARFEMRATAMDESGFEGPELPRGQEDITATVSVTYEIQ